MLSISLIFISFFLVLFCIYKLKKGFLYYLPLLLISIYSFFIGFASIGFLEYSFAKFWSNNGVVKYANNVSCYTLAILFFYLFSILINEKIEGKTKVKSYNLIEKMNKDSVKLGLRLSAIIVFLVVLLHLKFLNLSVLWSNEQYLLLASKQALKHSNKYSEMIQMLFPLLGLISVIIFSISYCLRDKKAISIIILPTIFFILLKIGDHSRFSAIYLGVLFAMLLISKYRYDRYILSPIFLLLCFGAVLNSLVGRGGVEHGLLASKDFFSNILSAFSSGIYLNLLGNIFEGAFVHGEFFYYLNHEYPEIYKKLSLSPFPSFIDGYAEKAHIYTLRLNTYVPMSATGEIFIFGPFYVFYYFLIVFLSINLCLKSLLKGKIYIFLVALFLICLGSYLQFAYPIRNVFRFFYLVILLYILFVFMPRLRWGK